MNIKFIGTGGAFDAKYGNSSAIIEMEENTILIDCGSMVFSDLQRLGLLDTIDYVLITHFHDDHIGSLSTLLFYYFVFLKEKTLTVLYPTEEFKEMLIKYLSFSMLNPEKFCRFESIDALSGITAIDTFGQHVPGLVSYAFYFREGNNEILYSGDIANASFLRQYLFDRKLQPTRIFHELSFYPSLVHTLYTELYPYLDLAPTYGYHCDPTQNPADNKIPLVYHSSLFLQT
jgi:glyoxylase-like metal-dependent hydrolase (beta-lactamase superfamily II)